MYTFVALDALEADIQGCFRVHQVIMKVVSLLNGNVFMFYTRKLPSYHELFLDNRD